MIHMLHLEAIGAANRANLRLWTEVINDVLPGAGNAVIGRLPSCPWVARIIGRDARFGLAREFVRPMVDYARSSGSGNRGVMHAFVLRTGVYEIRQPLSWKREHRYFARVQSGILTEITREDVEEWLQNGQPST